MLAHLDRVEAAGQLARDALDRGLVSLAAVRADRISGLPIDQIVDRMLVAGSREHRLGISGAFAQFERTLMEYRSALVKDMVDTTGISLTELATRMKVSRQVVGRLYREGDGDETAGDNLATDFP
ncbi:MAG: hypothetical protein NVSMB17_00360 [Candidatus Dormibacteria bacterium]